MPSYSSGVASGFTRNTSDLPLRNSGVALPAGRAMADGTVRAGILSLGTYLGSYSGGGTGTIQLGSAVTPAFALATGQEKFTGQKATNIALVNGGTANLIVNASQRAYFSGGGAGTTYDDVDYSWSGLMYLVVVYGLCPTKPTCTVTPVTSNPEQAVIGIGAPSDNGGATVSGYRIQRATDAGFTTGVVTTDAVAGDNLITGLTPGQQYYWRSTARNSITNAAGKLGGPWSTIVSAIQPSDGLGFIRNAGDTAFLELTARIRNEDDTDWLPANGRIRNATDTGWLELG